MEDDQIRNVADTIAKAMLRSAPHASQLDELRRSIDSLHDRLNKLEAVVESSIKNSSTSPRHPSQDHFSIAEAIADRLFGPEKDQKACTFEPNGKPCDHCSMCSSRGF